MQPLQIFIQNNYVVAKGIRRRTEIWGVVDFLEFLFTSKKIWHF